jgi:hypothetical protein
VVTLRKGARLAVPLWSRSVPQRHVYTAELSGPRHGSSLAVTGFRDGSPQRLVENGVWHQLELANPGDGPWTSGAALLMRDHFPLGQNLLAYTPPRGRTLVPVTVAVDLQVTQDEVELSRQPGALRHDDRSFSLVKKRGTISVVSHRSEASAVRVTLSTGGAVKAEGATVKLDGSRAGDFSSGEGWRVNNHSDATWELTVGPNEKRTLSYEVSVYE